MKKFLAVSLALILVACAGQLPKEVLTRDKYVVVKPPSSLYKCPQLTIKDFPNPDTATNEEISEILAKLYKYNKTCGYNLEAIKRYIAAAEKRLTETQK